MKVVITGGTGFIGLRLAKAILQRGTLTGPGGQARNIEEMLLFDQTVPEKRPAGLGARVTLEAGDISDEATVRGLIDRDDVAVFHLASVVSGGGEKDFDLAMRVNLEGHLHLLEALRQRGSRPRSVFASSIAVFGGARMPASVGDDTKQQPQTTYGMTKAVGELLINDYSRKGFLDGRAARLPTVIIRPGKPNLAASSFVSGVFREPLNGVDFALPVTPDTVMPLSGYRAIVDGIIHLYELDGALLGDDRAVGLPALTVTVRDMIDALQRVAGHRNLGRITIKPDAFIQRICATWPQGADNERAKALGFPQESGLDEIVAYYIEDYLKA